MSNRDFYLFSLSFNLNFVDNDGRSPVNHDAIITNADGVASSARTATDGVTSNARVATNGVTTSGDSATLEHGEQ